MKQNWQHCQSVYVLTRTWVAYTGTSGGHSTRRRQQQHRFQGRSRRPIQTDAQLPSCWSSSRRFTPLHRHAGRLLRATTMLLHRDTTTTTSNEFFATDGDNGFLPAGWTARVYMCVRRERERKKEKGRTRGSGVLVLHAAGAVLSTGGWRWMGLRSFVFVTSLEWAQARLLQFCSFLHGTNSNFALYAIQSEAL